MILEYGNIECVLKSGMKKEKKSEQRERGIYMHRCVRSLLRDHAWG